MNTKKTLAGIVASGAILFGGIDASVLNVEPVQEVKNIANERVEVKQIENEVQAEFSWKGEQGIKVKYDMGEPTAKERLMDKRAKQVITEPIDFGDGGFKVDVILNEKSDTNVFCYEIEGGEDYNFEYQRPLTEKEIKEGVGSSPEMEGSYAVYHKTNRDNEYLTGKVMHIPRPQVWEVENEEATKVWADLSYDERGLCVTAPQEFIDKANYPVRIDPTFGYTSLGSNTSGNGVINDYLAGSIFTGTGTGTLSSLSIHLTQSATNTLFKMGLYDTSGNYISNSQSAENTLVSSDWYTESTGAATIVAQDYLIVAWADGPATMRFDFITSKGRYGPETYSTNLPSTTSLITEDRQYSVYATYETAIAGVYTDVYGSGTHGWTPPDSSVTEAFVECWGGGGGGGDGANTGGGGGGGGAYAAATSSVVFGVTYPVVVGAGGAASIANGSGGAGGTSTFATSTVIAAPGSGGVFASAVNGSGGAGGSTANSSGTIEYAGGNGGGSKNTGDTSGGGGGAGGPLGAGTNGQDGFTSTTGGAGGRGNASTTPGGTGGNATAGGTASSSPLGGGGGGGGDDGLTGGIAGTVGGGGGGGENLGRAGAVGQCTITYTITVGGGTSTPQVQDVFWFD